MRYEKSSPLGQVRFSHIACFSLVFLLILGSFSCLVFGASGDSIDLNTIYVSGSHASLNTSTGVASFSSSYTYSYLNFKIPTGVEKVVLVSQFDDLYIQYRASSGASSATGITLSTGDYVECYPASGASYDFQIGVAGTKVSSLPSPCYISSIVTAYDTAVPSGVSLNYTFDNGYLFVIDLGSSGASYDYSLSSRSETLSTFLSGVFENTNQSYWFDSSLPDVDDSVPPSGSVFINWSRGGNRNVYGQTYDMVASLSGTASDRYLFIYNPPVSTNWAGSSNPTSAQVINYPVTISGLSDEDFWIYNTSGTLAITGSSEAFIDGTIVDDTGVGVISGGAIIVTDSDGNAYEQTVGGATDISGSSGGTLQNNIRGLQQTLDNLVSQLFSLLSAPISHIQQLISVGSNFMSAVSTMFSWIPAPVQGVLTSGLVLMVVIGVLKLLL